MNSEYHSELIDFVNVSTELIYMKEVVKTFQF